MPKLKIERVDAIPLLIKILQKMRIVEIIDKIWRPASQWQGLSYGQLSLLFIVYVIHERTHRLCGMESWVEDHHFTLTACTEWEIRVKDATDDRLGKVLEELGGDEERQEEFHKELGGHIVQAFELPSDVGRYDTTSFNVHHSPEKEKEKEDSYLEYGYSKDKRPDLLQFKQGLGVLDPAGVPLVSHTLGGNVSDDPLYVPAWREMSEILGKKDFLYIADSKAGSIEIRATLSKEGGYYLFPVPMTGKTPEWLREQVLNSLSSSEEFYPLDSQDKNIKPLGQGFCVTREMVHTFEDKTQHSWTEEWFVSQSYAHAQRQMKSLDARLEKATTLLTALRLGKEESDEHFLLRAQQLLEKYRVQPYLSVQLDETITHTKKYLKPGRPSPKSEFHIIEKRQLNIKVQKNHEAISLEYKMAGWRPFVANRKMTIQQTAYFYKDQWLVEHGMHRFKRGSIPVLPLWLQIPQRIVGLMTLLFVALQALTLIEFVVRRNISIQKQTLPGLYPGNPTRTTSSPSAESIIHAFNQLHLVCDPFNMHMQLNESLSTLQITILQLLELSEHIFDFSRRFLPIPYKSHHTLSLIQHSQTLQIPP